MSEEKASKKHHKRRKHYTVYPYFNYSILFVLITMVVVIPVLIVGMNSAVKMVHNAQEVLTRGYYDFSLDNSYEQKSEADYIDTIKEGKLIGTITCENVGMCEKVYYGTNRVTMRDGVGISTNSYLPNNGGCTRIAGYASSSFRCLHNVSIGDEIVLETYWGNFKYKVTDVYKAEKLKDIDGDSIALATFTSTEAFANQSSNYFYAVGELVSKEVK